jgi:hypothetical protein
MQGNADRLGVFYVTLEQLDDEWPAAAPLIELAQRRFNDKMDLADLYDDLKSAKQQLWLVKIGDDLKAAMMTMVEDYPKRRVLRIMLIGGRDMHQWLNRALYVIKDAAQRLGCKTIEADGRLGWIKHAPKCGFKEISRTYELEI